MAVDTHEARRVNAQSDPVEIDAILAQVWPNVQRRPLRLLVCAHDNADTESVFTFARSVADLLDAQLSEYRPVAGAPNECDALPQYVTAQSFDLLIWGEPHQSVARRLWEGSAYRKAVERIPTSLLVVRQPRWPLRHLLLVIQGSKEDETAAEWTTRLARAAHATVTVLTVVPPVPAMYAGCAHMQPGLAELLTTETALGRQMRRVARRLVEWEIDGTLRLRQGIPDQETCREMNQGDADLVFLSAEPCARWQRLLTGRCADDVLGWADRPVLIAKVKN